MTAWARDGLASMRNRSGVHRVGLALVEGGGRRLRFTATERVCDGRVQWCYVDAYDDVPLNTAVRTGSPVFGTLDQLAERYPGFVAHQRGTITAALAAVPVVAAGQTLGGYVLFFDHPQPFGPEQLLELARAGAALGDSLRRTQRSEARLPSALADEPVPPGAVVAVHHVPPDPAAVSQARQFLRRTLRDWHIDEDTADTAVLCLSELVTNAMIHAKAGCAVRVLLDRGIVSVTVRDSGNPDTASVEPQEDPMQVHGRGLQLVDALAARWGSRLDAGGTAVWFVLEI